jgi:hypothetical protein
MKRLGAALILGLVLLPFCAAQTQTGNASYNPSKPGLTISHSSLSFNTRVLVTNLRNNRSVEAVVNGRIPINSERIADISRDAGDTLGMDKTGMTLVEIVELHPQTGEPVPAAAPPAAVAAPQTPAPPPREQTPSPAQGTASSSASREQSSSSSQAPARILPAPTVTDIQYVSVPAPAGSNCCAPLLWVVVLLLLLVIIILLVILILFLRRLYLWPWHYQVWYRRHLLSAKKHRV